MAPYDAWKRRDRLDRSKPWTVRVEGDRAVVDSNQPVHGFEPLLLHSIDGEWRVDLAEGYKTLFYGMDGAPTVVNVRSPYMFGLGHLRSMSRPIDLSALDLGDRDEVEEVARLEALLAREPSAATHFRLAEILFRNCFAALDGLHHYREAARLAPDDPEILRATADRALYLEFPQIAIPLLERLGPEGWERLADAHSIAGNREQAERFYQLALDRNPSSQSARRGLASLRRVGKP
jgi:tetratricopeptide (TPR) repeat protein